MTNSSLNILNGELNLTERDTKHIWHPYTQHKTTAKHIGIVRGKDALLWDENGKEYIDAIASWWVNPFGHSNDFIAEANNSRFDSFIE